MHCDSLCVVAKEENISLALRSCSDREILNQYKKAEPATMARSRYNDVHRELKIPASGSLGP